MPRKRKNEPQPAAREVLKGVVTRRTDSRVRPLLPVEPSCEDAMEPYYPGAAAGSMAAWPHSSGDVGSSCSCIIARKNPTFRIGLSRWLRCCEYMAPKWYLCLQHRRDLRSTAPVNDEKSTETNPSVSPPR